MTIRAELKAIAYQRNEGTMQPTHVLCPVRGDPCAFLNSRRSEAEESVFCMCACPSLSYPPSSAASAQPQSPQQQLQPRALQMRNTDAALGLGSCYLRQWKTWPWLLGRSPARRLKLLAAMRDDRVSSVSRSAGTGHGPSLRDD